jgi:glucosamine--fructose-6-phosphate aminotransferase (isomerizing)
MILTACGTAWHAAWLVKYLLEDLARIPTETEYASEFRYRNPIINEGTVVIAISSPAKPADTLAALHEAKQRGATVLGVVNAVGSSIARETDHGIYLHVGPEIGVASRPRRSPVRSRYSPCSVSTSPGAGTCRNGRWSVTSRRW